MDIVIREVQLRGSAIRTKDYDEERKGRGEEEGQRRLNVTIDGRGREILQRKYETIKTKLV